MRCFVVFGVTLRLLVINISSSFLQSTSPLTTSDKCHKLRGYDGTAASYWQRSACCSRLDVVNTTPRRWTSRAVKPDIGLESRFLPTPPAFDAPVRGGGVPSEYCHAVWYGKLEWLGYPIVKKFRRYLYLFWHNVRTWQTHMQTDIQTPHDGIVRACIAPHGKTELSEFHKCPSSVSPPVR